MDSTPLTTELNKPQAQAVENPAQQLLVVAGAGSGKTRVLVTRILWFLQARGLRPGQIMAVTFTNKAANEMRERIEKALGYSVKAMWVGTFHGIAHRILRENAIAAGLPENFQIIDTDDQKRLIKQIMKKHRLDEAGYEPKAFIGYINRQKDEGRRPGKTPAYSGRDHLSYHLVYQDYEQQTRQLGLVDFGELLLRVHELFRDNAAVRESYQQRFPCVLVDEFQDTNTIQYGWLKALCGPDHHLTVVGDDDQSIYGWRGAKIENIQKFSKDYPQAATVRLEQNYRSTKSILRAANTLIQNNASRLGKELWTDGDNGEPIHVFSAINEVDEARYMVDTIQSWMRNGGRYDEVAILYRSNAQSRVLEQALRSSSIPYRIYGGLRFFERAEIRDILAYLRLAAHRQDDPALERVINVPPRGIGDKTLLQIREAAQAVGGSLWEGAKAALPNLSARAASGVRQFIALIESLDSAQMTLPALVRRVLDEGGLLAYNLSQTGDRGEARAENLQEFQIAVEQFQNSVSDPDADPLATFLSEVALDAGDREEGEQGVCLMTLHAAKGLEFPLVFIGGLEEGLFPHHRCQQDDALLEEERRLCYVGITRAMKCLHLTYAARRAFSGNQSGNAMSRFIVELPSECLADDEPTSSPFGSFPSAAPSRSAHVARRFGAAPAPELPFDIGSRVAHPKFGEGVVMSAEGSGESARVQINFAKAGVKWLVLSYAKLERLS